MNQLDDYQYRGARAMVLLHEQHMRDCLKIWKQAKAANIHLPKTTDTDYQSLETLLKHILGAARGYMVWMCRQLDLPDPEISPAPQIERIETEADSYLEHVLERWRLPLNDVEEKRFGEEYKSNWGVVYCIDGMMEHAVMHPIRHAFQLRELLAAQRN